jgi:hypothetical protein
MNAEDVEDGAKIREDADVNARDDEWRTALMKADDVEKARLLIERGADVNARDDY